MKGDFSQRIAFYFPSNRRTLAYTVWNVWNQTPWNNCQKSPSWRREHYVMRIIFVVFFGCYTWYHCGRYYGSTQVCIYRWAPFQVLHAIVYPANDSIYQQDNVKCDTVSSVSAWLEEHQVKFTIFPWPSKSVDINLIMNLWDHLHHVFHAMDSQLRNLA